MEQSQVATKDGMRRIVGVGAVVVALAVVLVAWSIFAAHRAGARLREQADAQAVVSVATIRARPQADAAGLTLPGNVEANTEAPIFARTSGYLKRWLVDIGTHVKAGQVLAEIDAPELDQQLRQSQADLATAEAGRDIANLTAERWSGLRNTGSVSKQAADEKISLAASSEAQVQAAQANLQRLRELSSFKKIVAPFDGIVTARNTDIGQLINAGGGMGPELFRIADMRQLRLYVRVPQAYAAMIQPDITAEVRFPDRPGRTYTAKLERTSNALDSVSRTLLAQLIIDNKDNELLPGAYAEVRFQLPVAEQNPPLRLPANVLLFRGDGLKVATVSQGRVVMKPVILGRDYGSDVEIVGGLTAGEEVILSPPDSLMESTVVRVVQVPAEPAAK